LHHRLHNARLVKLKWIKKRTARSLIRGATMQASQKWSEKRWERLRHRKAAKSAANVSEHHPCLGTSNVLYSWWPNSTFLSWTCRHPLYPPPHQYNSHCKIPTLSQQQGCLRWPCLSNTPAMEAPRKIRLLPPEQG